jgi:hypothetical protein
LEVLEPSLHFALLRRRSVAQNRPEFEMNERPHLGSGEVALNSHFWVRSDFGTLRQFECVLHVDT